jgi:hypothetical protein
MKKLIAALVLLSSCETRGPWVVDHIDRNEYSVDYHLFSIYTFQPSTYISFKCDSTDPKLNMGDTVTLSSYAKKQTIH